MRMYLLKTCSWLSLAAAAFWVNLAAAAADQPNIVHIVADDLGWKDVGFHGSDIQTPALDALAETGARLETFYAQPMCTPTRACLMTGRYPLRYGMQTGVVSSGHNYGLPTDEWLLPQALTGAGYTTAIIGKWHLGHGDRRFWPGARGFDYQYGPLGGEVDYFTHEENGIVDWFRNGERVEEEGYATTLFGDEAVRYINTRDASKPFFLYLAFTAPHTPFQAPEKYLERYTHIKDPTRRTYAAMITALDDQIGRVVDAIESRGLRDNTLVIFHGDNGGTRNAMMTGGRDLGNVTVPCENGPYRGGKGSLYEGGTRVVALASWPGRIEAGIVDEMIHVVDLYPTILGLAGADTSRAKPLDGMDIWATIAQGRKSPRTEIVYNVERFRGAVRSGDWKLVWRALLPPSLELFNLAEDPSETQDLAAEYPARVTSMQARVVELAEEMSRSMLIATEFAAIRERLRLPPALPDEDIQFDDER